VSSRHMNPYLAGLLLGLVLLAAIFVSGRGLGASGAVKSAVVAAVTTAAPAHAKAAPFYSEYVAEHAENPLKQWLVFEVIGVAIGAFLSGLVSGRLTWQTERGPGAPSSGSAPSSRAGARAGRPSAAWPSCPPPAS
jgi:hypothetical protein